MTHVKGYQIAYVKLFLWTLNSNESNQMDLIFSYEMKKLNLRHRDYGYKIADESTKDFSSCLFKT